MENIFVEFLPPWIETGCQPAFYDKESGTVLQQTARMYDRVNMLVRMFNKLSKKTKETVEEYINKFNELHDYVHNYFDNLDVQEEINNKLDAMYEDGTLEAIIGEYLTPMVKILFCKQKGEVQSGDATLIKAYDKNVLIDTHLASLKSNIEAFLTRNEATHLDYVILTHYHPDHVGNVKNLCDDGYIDSETTVYLPGYTHLIADNVSLTNAYLEVTGALTTAGATVVQPTESTTLTIEDATFKFYNCTQQIFDVEEQYTSYNDCSTVVELDYGTRKALFTGDIEVKPFERFERLNQFPYKIDFYTIEHHGINYTASVLPFLSRITPDFAVQSAELGDFSSGAIGQGATPIYLKSNGCKIYSTYNNPDDIKFDLTTYEVRCASGIENYSTSNRRPNIPIYVDPTTTSLNRDGSQSQPYKYLQEALSRVPQNNQLAYTIYLADGTYEDSAQSSVLGKISGNTEINIVGNQDHPENVVINKSCQIYNGAYVKYSYVTFKDQIAYIENATLTIDHCSVSPDSSISNAIYSGGNCNIKLVSSTLDSCSIGVSAHSDKIVAYNNTFSNMTTAIQVSNTGTVQEHGNTYTTVTNRVVLYDGSVDLSRTIPFADTLWSGEVNDLNTDLDLAQPLTRYNLLLVTLGYGGSTPNQATVWVSYHDIQNFYKNSYLMSSYSYSSGGNATPGLLRLSIGADVNKIQVTKQDGIKVRKIVGVKLPL